MKCPHCLAELKYRERSGKKCPHCQRQFALEPRESVLKMSDLRLRRIAERLGELRIAGTNASASEQRYRYTSLQLAYAALRKYQPHSLITRSMIRFILGCAFLFIVVLAGGSLILALVLALVFLFNYPDDLFNKKLFAFKAPFKF